MSTGLEALLAGGAGAGGPVPEMGMEPPDGGGDPMDIYSQILDLLRQALAAEDSEVDRLQVEKITTMIQQLKADEEKEAQDALGGKMSPKMLSKAYGG